MATMVEEKQPEFYPPQVDEHTLIQNLLGQVDDDLIQSRVKIIPFPETKTDVQEYLQKKVDQAQLTLVTGKRIFLLHPRNHFVSRKYRQLKEMVQPTSLKTLEHHLKQLVPLMRHIVNPAKINLDIQDTVLSTDKSQFTNQIQQICDQFEHQVKEFTATRISRTKEFWDAIRNMILEVELVDASKTDDFGKMVTDLVQTEYDFNDPDQDRFLDDESLEFYIFRETKRTIYVIKNESKFTFMIQHKGSPNQAPLPKIELEHLRSCHTRWMRGKQVHTLPYGFRSTPRNVRRLVFSKKQMEQID